MHVLTASTTTCYKVQSLDPEVLNACEQTCVSFHVPVKEELLGEGCSTHLAHPAAPFCSCAHQHLSTC